MQDIGQNPHGETRRSGMRTRTIAALIAGCVLAGAAGMAWLGWRNGFVDVDMSEGVPQLVTGPTTAAPPAPSVPAAQTAAQVQLADASTKVAMLEQRLAELNQQAIAASGNATRAESLLLAFAARRALERGQPLGWIETPLRARFGTSQGAAVDRLIAASTAPVTLAQLGEQFELLAPQLAGASPDEGTWTWLSRQVSGLFVIRHDDAPSPAPESRIVRTRAFLAGGKVEAAIAEVERLPGQTTATDWLAHARDYMAAQRALDQIEAAALMGAQPVAAPSAVPTGEVTPMPEASDGAF
ncbi:MAG: hypothetical protein B7Y89_14670 [Novosphingobium sp. 32-60-15]|nr:MAG: hypothetical protein B7Y89_14670 [Novosphingobium sp. 32-60-15]